jgi:uncharacterized NAD(P)/FAD-binding protein YdhS
VNALLPLRQQIVIIGGGVSGAATAWNLVRSRVNADITIVEPRGKLGHGLAYSATDPAHRINVPAAKMSIDPDTPSHFMDWLAAPAGPLLDPATVTAGGDFFPQRSVFGAYMADCLAPMLRSGAIRHLRAAVGSVTRNTAGDRYLVQLADHSTLHADILVIATGHPLPDLPAGLHALAGSPRIIANPYDMDRILSIGAAERVLILGSGLTSADVIASLDRRGFWGRLHTVSRHGYRSRGHGRVTRESEAEFWRTARSGTVALLRHVRQAVAADAARGQSWHAVFDRLRADGSKIWDNLDPPARSRLVRHLRTLWDVHRFRIAPQAQEAIDRLTSQGVLSHQAARLVGAADADGGIDVTLRPRGSRITETRQFDRIVVTTGPAHGSILRKDGLLATLAGDGLVAADPLGLGLAVAEGCCAISSDGAVSESLFVAGPLARGGVGELMGLPEVTRHARRVAEGIARQLQRSPGDHEPPGRYRDADSQRPSVG